MGIQPAQLEDMIELLQASADEKPADQWNWFGGTWQVEEWNEWRRQNRNASLCLDGVNLSRRNLSYANFRGIRIRRADLSFSRMVETDFVGSDLSHSRLVGANLYGALLDQAILSHADLRYAILWWVTLVETVLHDADISYSRVYGVSPWRVDLTDAIQRDLDISRYDEETITVDDLEIAHFTYMLLENSKLRNVIDTITTRMVLILGRFTDERKHVLDAIKQELRHRGYLPMLFDFEPSTERDLTETIQIMAGMSKFIIADITEAKSIPQELSHIIPNFPSIPVKPILLSSDAQYGMFPHWSNFPSVLPAMPYLDEQDLISRLDNEVIQEVQKWQNGQDESAALKSRIFELENAILRLSKQ